MYSIIYGNPLDQFPYNAIKDYKKDSLLHVQFLATAGSEAGEPMLNIFTGGAGENRDHYTKFLSAVRFPNKSFDMFYSYQYVDNYSDRYDGLWNTFAKAMGKEMAYSEEGLAKEISAGFTLYAPIASMSLKTTSYRHWGATPYFFGPVHSRGYLVLPSVNFNFKKSALTSDFFFDYHRDYFDHLQFNEFTDEGWDISWDRKFKNGMLGSLSHHRNSRFSPSSYAQASMHDTLETYMAWTVLGKIYNNLRLGGLAKMSYIQIPKIAFTLEGGWDVTPREREYSFRNNKSWVDYQTRLIETAYFHSTFQYHDTLLYPIKASIWVDYCDNPLWESVQFIGTSKTIIRQDTISNAAHLTTGAKGSYLVSYKKLSALLWGNMVITPKNKKVRFSLPMNFGADLAYGKPDNDSLYIGLRIESRDRAVINYKKVGSKKTLQYVAPAQTSASLDVRIPLILPFAREHVRTNLFATVGPIHFLSEAKRIKEHPAGNKIGPLIALGVKGFFN